MFLHMGDLLQTGVQVVFKTITWILICCSQKEIIAADDRLEKRDSIFPCCGSCSLAEQRSTLLNVFSTQSKFGTPNAKFWIILG